ncbi:MAG: hypothetical protein GXY49_02080 [Syntrophomonadaceae bacterium]|nr:hypothetical protein [Syntrophomonadaceae bacterium]
MLKGLGIIVITICALPLMVAALAFMACYTPLYCLYNLISSALHKGNNNPVKVNESDVSILSNLRVKHV